MLPSLLENKWKNERTSVKKEVKVGARYNPENIIPIDIRNNLRDEEIESRKKEFQEQKL
jgi:hypothetical protein